MPMFEYNCDNCNYSFDRLVISRDTTVDCPLCRGEVRKLMSTFSVGARDTVANKRPGRPGRKMCTGCG